jgi:hypothetical protein
MSGDPFKLGQHEADIQTLKETVGRIELAVNDIQQSLAEQRGERRVALWLVGMGGGALGSILTAWGKSFLVRGLV